MKAFPTYVTSTALAAALLLAGATAFAATAYRWVDAQGVVHIQDQPHEGAEEIELGSPPTYHADPANTSYAARATAAKQNDAEVKFTCSVTQPLNDAVLFENVSITISVSVQPGLRGSDHLNVSYDGMTLPAASPGATSFTVSPVDRGEHTVVATLLDANSKTLCTTAPVTFYVRQPGLRAR
ncbi:MAG TPA: DUF4124 domain-containing protein [Steroidobacteraceae bacterium]|nr:DUF4124 domain-containing protein [Steroidobacteraceae bacterium]